MLRDTRTSVASVRHRVARVRRSRVASRSLWVKVSAVPVDSLASPALSAKMWGQARRMKVSAQGRSASACRQAPLVKVTPSPGWTGMAGPLATEV